MADLPDLLDSVRHRELGRQAGVWARRAVLVALVAVLALALGNAFGQQPTDESAAGTAGSLVVHAPDRLRDGLLFQARFTIVARQRIAQPTLVLDPGWFERITVNTIVPQPKAQIALDGRLGLTFDALKAGRRLVVWIDCQVNPPGGGPRDQGVDLRDGGTLLVRIPRTVTIVP